MKTKLLLGRASTGQLIVVLVNCRFSHDLSNLKIIIRWVDILSCFVIGMWIGSCPLGIEISFLSQ